MRSLRNAGSIRMSKLRRKLRKTRQFGNIRCMQTPDTDPRSPPDGDSVVVALGERAYEIAITSHRLGEIAALTEDWRNRRGLKSGAARSACIITDKNVETPHARTVAESLQAAGWKVRTAILEPGEQ